MTTAKEFGEFEFAVGSVNGLRAFEVDALGRLTGVSHKSVWLPGENAATCPRRCHDDPTFDFDPNMAFTTYVQRSIEASRVEMRTHEVPGVRCGCGFWAYYNGEDGFAGSGTVTGIVQGYGRTVMGSKGFRCEKARIVALVLPDARTPQAMPWSVRLGRRIPGSWRAPSSSVAAGLFVGMLTVGVQMAFAGRWVAAAAAIAFLSPAALLAWGCWQAQFHKVWGESAPAPRVSVTSHRSTLIRRNYPDVPVFASKASALKAFPVAPPVESEISPKTTEDFWTRSAS